MKVKVLIALVIVFALIGTNTTYARYSGGDGSAEYPYRIATPNDLNDIDNHPNDLNKHFVMVNDINLADYTATQFNIIGNDSNAFTGIFDGNSHTIMNFTYGISYAGGSLFGVVDGQTATIKNLTMADAEVNEPYDADVACLVSWLKQGQVSNCHIINGRVRAENFCGLLVGLSYSQISNCSASGVCSANEFAGGLVGDMWENATVTGCISDVNVTVVFNDAGGLVGVHDGNLITNSCSFGTVTGGRGNIGGLVGSNESTIQRCYSNSEVIGGDDEGVGGLVGTNSGSILRCFSNGSVSGVIDVGGLVGYNFTDGNISDSYSFADVNASCCYAGGLVSGNKGTVQRCYSTGMVTVNNNPGGGLVSHNHENVTESFWDIEASGCNNSDGGTGLPTAQMQTESTFTTAGWDFVEIWNIGENQTYPYLRVYPAGDLNHDGRVDFSDFAIAASHWLEGTEP